MIRPALRDRALLGFYFETQKNTIIKKHFKSIYLIFIDNVRLYVLINIE